MAANADALMQLLKNMPRAEQAKFRSMVAEEKEQDVWGKNWTPIEGAMTRGKQLMRWTGPRRGKVSVIGIGRLGLCWALNLERAGFDVVGVDIFPEYVKAIQNKTFRSKEPLVNELLQSSKYMEATMDTQKAFANSDVIYLLVQTPSTGGKRHYDCAYLARALGKINAAQCKNKHIVIGCTVMPTYCKKVAMSLIPNCEGCTISYSPEFIAQGDIVNGQLWPDMTLIGEGSPEAGALMEEHARAIVMPQCKHSVCRMSTTSAEIAKLSVNCFVTTKISFANMVGDMADKTEGLADKYEILAAVGCDSRIGGKYIRPGYGYGGPCFPRDNRALAQFAEIVGIDAKVSKATDNYNNYHTLLQAEDLLATGQSRFTFEDVAYKPNCPVDIVEESQKLEIARIIARRGKNVVIRDRDFIVNKVRAIDGNLFEYEVVSSFAKKA